MGAHERTRHAFSVVTGARAWSIDLGGWVVAARRAPSPNFDARPAGTVITLLIIHNISLPPGEFGGSAIESFFLNRLDHEAHPFYGELRGVRVSAHFLIRRDGELIQFVSCDERAWHAGASQWQGREHCNDFSIGIELEGTDEVPYADLQYSTLASLSRSIADRYPITAVVGHSDVAPVRKSDPGPAFDWSRYLRQLAFV
jgi:AmpD protein